MSAPEHSRRVSKACICFVFCAGLRLLLCSAPALAAEPNLRNINVRGLQVGGTTTITIDGDEFGKNPRLLLPFEAKQTVKKGSTDKQAVFEVSLDDKVTPGFHHLRMLTDQGVSLPVVIGVDRLPQQPLGPTIPTLPAAVHGTVTGSTVAETTFTGKAGEKVVIEVEAQRLGSKLRPIVHLSGPRKLQLGWSWGTPSLHGDARLETTLPEAGSYTIAIHDAEYAGQSPGFFRLKVGNFDYIDQVFPPVVGKNATTVELSGSATARVTLPPAKHDSVLAWPKDRNTWTGPRPWVEVSSRPEFVEETSAKVQELPHGPLGVSGKLAAPNEEDRYKLAVKPNTRVRLEVFAERIGSPVDAALVIRNTAGAVLAQVEDSPGTLDPVLEYAVPDKVDAIIVGVIDSAGRGGPRAIYRLTVDDARPAGLGDFHLTTPIQRLTLPDGGRQVVPVHLDRRGYTGKVTLSVEGLPAGVKLEGTTIPADADGALVVVNGKLAVPSILHWKGLGENGEARDGMQKGNPMERLQPWLASELTLAPTTASSADFAIDWRNLSADAGLAPAGKLALPVSIKRIDPAAPVRLVLLTSQSPPLVNNQPDPNRTIRAEKPVELAAKASDGELTVLVPAELKADAYQLAVQAELLSPDKQRVLATAVTPVRSFSVRLPVAVKIDGGTRFTAKLDAKMGATVEIKGTVERKHDFKGEVQVALTGVPPGVALPPPAVVKDKDTAFSFKLVLPAAIAATEARLEITASVVPDPKQPNVRVKSRTSEAILVIQPPAK
jgi:hypothetical protein